MTNQWTSLATGSLGTLCAGLSDKCTNEVYFIRNSFQFSFKCLIRYHGRRKETLGVLVLGAGSTDFWGIFSM